MEPEEENAQILKKLKAVKIVDDKTEIVDVKEKHGYLYKSIPKVPIAAAVIFCFLNIILPGVGKSTISIFNDNLEKITGILGCFKEIYKKVERKPNGEDVFFHIS